MQKYFDEMLYLPVGPLSTMLRSMILSRMGQLGHEPTVAEAQRRLDRHLSGETPLVADLRNAVYGGVLKNGAPEYFGKMLEVFIFCVRVYLTL